MADIYVVSVYDSGTASTYVLCAFSDKGKALEYMEDRSLKARVFEDSGIQTVLYLTPLTINSGQAAYWYEDKIFPGPKRQRPVTDGI